MNDYIKGLFYDITDEYSEIDINYMPLPFNVGMPGDRHMIHVMVGRMVYPRHSFSSELDKESLEKIEAYNQKLNFVTNSLTVVMNRMIDDGHKITTYVLFPTSYSNAIIIEFIPKNKV